MITETPQEQAYALLQTVRNLGFVVVAFSPNELRGVDARNLEDVLSSRGNEFIDDHATVPDIEELTELGYEVRPAPAASDYKFDAYSPDSGFLGMADTEEEAWEICHDYHQN